ncbi:MAG: chemotaxis protein CheR [Ferruginibacter sp.]|uniref:chemotaxis protein CheB n=1 Tax=Ferruginibacter sp. TaxID=1940288 RepID=UPI002658A796|nr:chemotaxis protein CheB [Ferruginibacter sp.]MDB5276953.1 chemotaxis protein CheR [Ferruginibacter sp.]
MSTVQPHHIIAIGASAGGLDEINAFFDHTPMDGVSYVIVQHLSPDFKSRMSELLARHSKLVVKEAGNEMAVECNQVYLIPNNKFMTIHENKLYLTDKENIKGPHLTVNAFFNSLAADYGKKAIAVVLSGLGSDGTEGVKAIKKAGGMVIARNPETAEFGSMPANAIATGLVDFILEPALMPATIEDYVKQDGLLLTDDKDDEKNLTAIISLINEKLPLDFSEYKQPTILRRIKRRAAYNNFSSLEKYLEFLTTSPEEVKILAQDFLISVTTFFRDAKAFDFIQTDVLPVVLKGLAKGEELKIWVAGCATGEEAYSLAILIHEQLKDNLKEVVVKIFATDIDAVALVHAGKGIYAAGIAKDITPERLEKYFITEGDSYKVKPEIRSMLIFAQHNIVKNPPYCNMHFISCRNLLIYMTPVLQKKIFLMLLFGLKRDGYLFLGSSENPMPILQHLEVVNKKWKIYKNLETKRTVNFDGFSLPQMADVKDMRTVSALGDINEIMHTNLAEAVNTAFFKELDYLVVCVDENGQVVKTYGDTTQYLLQKNFNLNLVELLPRPLAVAYNTLSIQVKKTGKKAAISAIKMPQGEAEINVTIAVKPLVIKTPLQRLLMVTFSEDKLVKETTDTGIVYDEKKYFDQYTLILEEELNELKEKLNNTYEQLDASNDNMQSYNEELLSANEEMQSTNEEMQSVNEELHTINADYQLKNKELQEVNDDLDNYFKSNINGQLFVNNNLILMKFSPGTVKQINLQPGDIGRPLSDISTNIKFETIANDIKQVIKDGTVISKEIETNNGKWYQVMTMPYTQQADRKNTGAILTFNDITTLKQAQLELDEKNESLSRINADLENFVNTASHDLLGPLSSIEMSIDVMNAVKVVDPELNNFLAIINTSVKKFRTLISEIANIAKIEGDMKTLEMVDLDEIMNNIEWSLDNKIAASKAVIHRQLEVKQILFSKKNLRSILYNLISNSIKFKGEQPPVVHLHTKKLGNHVVLSVQDNGIGIDTAHVTKIFDMYGRIHHDVEGQGIGLYLAKKIVDAAKGNIVVESELGKGSKFIIYLPG